MADRKGAGGFVARYRDLQTAFMRARVRNPALTFVTPSTQGEPTDLPEMYCLKDTSMLAHNAHLPPGIHEDAGGNKLLHIAGMRSSNGQGNVNRDIPIVVREEDGVIVKASTEMRLL